MHYPTDISLLFDGIRKVIQLVAQSCKNSDIAGWRQSEHNIKKIKQQYCQTQKLKHSTAKDENKKTKRTAEIIAAHEEYINEVSFHLGRAKKTVKVLRKEKEIKAKKISEIERYIKHVERQIDQIRRRVIQDEKIPHNEKVFSLFEEYTEWISKGKAGVPQELGLKVCVLRDQYGFILHHQVMQNQTDDEVAVSMVKAAKERFSHLCSCSFDKGFHSPYNQKELRTLLDRVILPKKGKLSRLEWEREHSEEFVKARHQHSAVESSINALEVHGLDRCQDRGIDGFKRYVGLAVVARNIQILGDILHKKEIRRRKRIEKLAQTRKNKLLGLAA